MTASIQRIERIPGLYPPTGPWIMAVAVDRLIFISGIRGIDPRTNQLVSNEDERLSQLFENLKAAIEGVGSDCSHVVSSRVYITDMRRLRPKINTLYERYFGGALPTRTIVEVRALNDNDIAEIEVVALKVS